MRKDTFHFAGLVRPAHPRFRRLSDYLAGEGIDAREVGRLLGEAWADLLARLRNPLQVSDGFFRTEATLLGCQRYVIDRSERSLATSWVPGDPVWIAARPVTILSPLQRYVALEVFLAGHWLPAIDHVAAGTARGDSLLRWMAAQLDDALGRALRLRRFRAAVVQAVRLEPVDDPRWSREEASELLTALMALFGQAANDAGADQREAA